MGKKILDTFTNGDRLSLIMPPRGIFNRTYKVSAEVDTETGKVNFFLNKDELNRLNQHLNK